MNNTIVRFFTDPSILQQLGHNRLARFFQDFELEMRDIGNRLPFPSPEDPTSLDRLAAAFARTDSLPEKMRNALPLIEAAAAPKNAQLLDSVIQRRLPCISLNRSCPLDCALELWFACPEELPQFTASKRSEDGFACPDELPTFASSSPPPERSEVPIPNRGSSTCVTASKRSENASPGPERFSSTPGGIGAPPPIHGLPSPSSCGETPLPNGTAVERLPNGSPWGTTIRGAVPQPGASR